MSLTLAWYSPSGATSVVNGMEEQGATPEGTTPGKVQASSQAGSDTGSRSVDVAGVERLVMSGGLHVPVTALTDIAGTLRLAPGWECRVVAVADLADMALLGRRYRVVDVPVKSYATARRLDVVDVTHLDLP